MTMSLVVEHFDDLLATPEDVEQVNRVILQLAMQGKLVLQDPNDEPASELLKRVQIKKQRLIEDKTIAQDAKLEPITPEEKSFDLPHGWVWSRLGSITKDITRYPTFYGMEHLSEGVPVIRGEHINLDGTISHEWNNYWHVTPEISSQFPRTITEKNDLIMMVRGSIGKLGFVDDELVGAQVSPNCIRISYFDTECFPKYLFYFLRSSAGKSSIQENVRSTAIQTIKASDFEATVVPLPPFAEQQRIVARVEELFAQTRALAKELAHSQIELDGLNKSALSHLLASETPPGEFNQHWDFIAEHFDLLFQTPEHVAPLRQSILELAVRGKLTRREARDQSAKELLKRVGEEKEKTGKGKSLLPVKDSEKPFEIPEGWEWARLQDLTETITKGSSPKWQGVEYVNKGEGVLFITSKNVGQFSLITDEETYVEEKFNEIEPRSILKKDDILMNIVGASIGRSAIYNLDTVANINQAVCLIRLVDHDLLDKDYFILFFNSSTCIGYMSDKQVDNARANLSMGNIANFAIPVPPLAEQERIVKRVEQLLSLCDALEAGLQSAEEERGRLVAAVMAGVGG